MNSLVVLAVILAILMLAISGLAGLRNLIGLVLNFGLLLFAVFLISSGLDGRLILLIFVPIVLAIAIFMSSNDNQVTNISFKTSLIVVVIIFVLAMLAQHFGQFQGFGAEDTDELENLSLAIGVNFSNLAIVVMVISSLGAIAESAMAVVEALHEIIEENEDMNLTDFHAQRFTISQQILGTAINTLFFGMLGGALGLLLWFARLHYTFSAIINSKLLGAEIIAMLLGFLGILLSIWLAGYFMEKAFESGKIEE